MKILNNLTRASCIGLAILIPSITYAYDKQQVEDKLKQTFTNFQATYIQKSPVNGLYEIHTTDNIIYFSPESETMFIGRVFNKKGEDLTKKSLTNATKKRMNEAGKSLADLFDKAVVVNEGGNVTMTVFSNPDCTYCHMADKWIKKIEAARNIKIEKRIIFMANKNLPNSEEKMRHIICAEDQGYAYSHIQDIPKELYQDCPEATDILATHDELVKFFGVNGTPSFLLDNGEIIGGLNRKRLSDVIDEKMKMEISRNEQS